MKTSSDQQAPTSGVPSAFLPAVRRFFQRRVPGQEVEDLVQEVFVSLQARKAGSLIENNEAYLFTIARNVLTRHWQQGRRTTTSGEMADANHIRDMAPLQDQRLLDKESLSQALQAIEGMSTRTRNIFLMHRFEDMTYHAIAQQVGISTSAVEKHIMLALQTLVRATGRRR